MRDRPTATYSLPRRIISEIGAMADARDQPRSRLVETILAGHLAGETSNPHQSRFSAMPENTPMKGFSREFLNGYRQALVDGMADVAVLPSRAPTCPPPRAPAATPDPTDGEEYDGDEDSDE